MKSFGFGSLRTIVYPRYLAFNPTKALAFCFASLVAFAINLHGQNLANSSHPGDLPSQVVFASAQVTAINRPNLIPLNVMLSSYSARPGDVVLVAWTMTNASSANCPPSYTGLHLGFSASAPPATDPLDLTFITPEIPARSAVRQTNSITIPATAPLGTYYLWVVADEEKTLNQSSTADDNARSSALGVESVRRQPNLRPLMIELSAPAARPGDPVTVYWTLTNSGNVTCPASLTGLHLGTSSVAPPVSDGWNFLVTTPEIPANSSVQMTNLAPIPPGTALGTYYVWVVADDVPTSTLNQSSRNDDAARSGPLSVVSVVARPNLVPLDITLSSYSARRGDQLTVMWTLTNSGTGNCPASTTGLHLGSSATAPPTSDGLNVKVATPAIAAGASVRITNVVTIPLNNALSTFYLWVVADDVPNSTLNQTSKADDAARSAALTIATVVTRPNLLPQTILLSTYSARPGDQLAVMWTTTNAGSGNCAASLTGLHLGSSATVPPTNDGVNLQVPTPPINAHSAVRQTNLVTIPANTPIGNYYLWVKVDDVVQSTLDQTTRTDDAARSGLLAVLTVVRQPNLLPENVLLNSDFALPGGEITVRWRMRNSGTATCPTSLTGFRLGVSPSVPPTNDTLNAFLETPEIPPGSSIQQTNRVTIPANTPAGLYYLWVIADAVENSTLNQSSRSDDAEPSGPLTIATEAPRPNLVPVNVALNVTSVAPGGQVTLTWTMTNSGTANCPASTTGLHLGTSTNAAPTNDILNLKLATPVINAHTALQQSRAVTIPAGTAPGTYYLWVVADDVATSTLNQISRLDDTARSGPLVVGRATLTSPEPNEIVGAPPIFIWSAPGIANANVYLARKPAPVLGTDAMVFFDNPTGTNAFRPTSSNWAVAVNALGLATNYYWTVGSSNAAVREIFAEWRAFKALPMVHGGTVVPGSGGDFRLQVLAPNHAEVIVQGSDLLTNGWVDLGTLPNTNGTVIFTDETAGTRMKRFYRPKP